MSKKNDIMKVHNDINLFSLGDFTKTESDVLMATILEIYKADGNDLTISLSKLKRFVGCKMSTANFLEIVKRVASKLLHLRVWNTDNGCIEERNIFHKYKIDTKKDTLTIVVIPEERYLFCELTEQFLKFDYAQYSQLPNGYAKSLYRLCMQWKSVGRFVIDIERFRFAMGIPEDYKASRVDMFVIKPAIEALSDIFDNLQYRKIYGKRDHGGGKKITAYEFTFEKPKKNKEQSAYDRFIGCAVELGIPEAAAQALYLNGIIGEENLLSYMHDKENGIPF